MCMKMREKPTKNDYTVISDHTRHLELDLV